MPYKSIKALGNLIVLWPQSGLKAEWQLSPASTSAFPEGGGVVCVWGVGEV